MKTVSFLALALLLAVFSAPGPTQAQEEAPSVGNLFIKAYMDKNKDEMKKLVSTRTKEFPPEVKAMVEYALSPDAQKEEQDFLFNIAGMISKMYADQTGDKRLLDAVRSNYESLLKTRGSSGLTRQAVAAVKKELADLGGGDWRVSHMDMNDNSELIIEIDVRASSGGEGFTPHIDFRKSKKAKDIVKKHLPGVKKGKISWSSMGVGLKTAFLEQ